MAFGAAHCSSVDGQCGLGSGADSATVGAEAWLPCSSATVCGAVFIDPGMAIDIGIGMAGRASPDRHTNSAHTSSTPDHARNGGSTRCDMRAMLGHDRQQPRPAVGGLDYSPSGQS